MTAAWCGCGGSREDSSAEIDRKMLASGTAPPASSRMRDGASLSRKAQEPSGRRKYAPAVLVMPPEIIAQTMNFAPADLRGPPRT